ncbi:MAG: inorganic diphosphatase, partial [Planctomycetales bacterium]|nr:inorganic diphosphatase [Planctomycetales bacterium]
LLSKERGGDGDPLDVLLLGPSLPRGSIVQARVIGVLKLLDGGEQDDKLIAVVPSSEAGDVHNFAQLKSQFNGALDIVETWFSNYKGPGEMESKGIGSETEANALLDEAITIFEASLRPAVSN